MTDTEFKECFAKQIQAFTKYSKDYKKKHKYNTQDVILLRLDLIGDCTMFSSAAKALREFYKDRKMTVVCLKICEPIFERIGGFDRIITVDFKPHNIDYEKLDLVIKEIQKYEFDILLQPQLSRFPLNEILCIATNCNKRIALEGRGNSPAEWYEMTSFVYDALIPYPRDKISEFDFTASFVRGIMGEDFRITKPILNFNKQNFVKEDYFVLFPAASLKQKYWPPERFAKVVDYICKRTNLKCVILGAKSEKWVSDLIFMNVRCHTEPYIIDLCGKTTIDDVIDIIGNSKLVVTNDTSGVHIACATNTPSVAINGGWHFNRFLPYSIEDVKPTDKLPLVAYTKMNCYFCNSEWPTIAKTNPSCLERIKNEDSFICIQKVRTEQVVELVDKILSEQGY